MALWPGGTGLGPGPTVVVVFPWWLLANCEPATALNVAAESWRLSPGSDTPILSSPPFSPYGDWVVTWRLGSHGVCGQWEEEPPAGVWHTPCFRASSSVFLETWLP